VKAVQSDPYKYGLEIEEVSRRKRLVDEVGGEVEDMREELQKTLGNVAAAGRLGGGGGGGFDSGTEVGPDYTTEFEQQQQMVMMREQDQDLEGVFRTGSFASPRLHFRSLNYSKLTSLLSRQPPPTSRRYGSRTR
jgi:t-SNARE syntaxin family protein